ncbi:phospholipase D-like domain-containing protein [Kalamiella sp. sgz302252]|uniref:phospholipase D-like domain-containing protein n=1 Tax=Pantoea sp. sgz302252 TaxID=3341827 RepID=UPI0036D38092
MPEAGKVFRRIKQLICCGLLLCSPFAQAKTPGFELIYDAPAETTLAAPDLRRSSDVWQEMFANAREQIDIAQFYVANEPGSRLDKVIQALRQAGERGVKIRFLLDKNGLKLSTPETLAQLQAIPGVTLRVLPFSKLAGGIIHAKYILVDGRQSFVGSQNFDWRALEHIQETGLLIGDAAVVTQIAAIFNHDWAAQPLLAAGEKVPEIGTDARPENLRAGNYLVASPRAWNPAGIADSQAVLPQLLASARESIRVQVMEYAPLSFGAKKSRPFYAVIDNALRAAAARGVQIELMVASWNTKQPDIAWLKSLALVPGITIKVVTIPEAGSGFIPYARVVHSKIMTIDGELAWVGTSNWSGGYFDNSRNLELVLNDAAMAQRLNALYQQLWQSRYADPLRIDFDYPAPDPGGLKRQPH